MVSIVYVARTNHETKVRISIICLFCGGPYISRAVGNNEITKQACRVAELGLMTHSLLSSISLATERAPP